MTDTTKTEALPHEWACAVSWAARLPLTGVYSLRNADILAIQRRLSAVEAERDRWQEKARELAHKDLPELRAERDRLAAECEELRKDVEHKDLCSEQLGRELMKAHAECKALRACATKYLGWLNVKNPAKSLEQDITNPEMIGGVAKPAAMGGKE